MRLISSFLDILAGQLIKVTEKYRIILNLVYQFPQAAVTKYHKLRGLEQQKCLLSQFWRLEVPDQGVSRAALPVKPTGEDPFRLFQLLVLLASLVVFGSGSPSVSASWSSSPCLSLSSLLLRTPVGLD